jgi:hypothetical protein
MRKASEKNRVPPPIDTQTLTFWQDLERKCAEDRNGKRLRVRALEWLRLEALWRSASQLTPEEHARHATDLERIKAGKHHALLNVQGEPVRWLFNGVPLTSSQRREPIKVLATVKRCLYSTESSYTERLVIELDSTDLDIAVDEARTAAYKRPMFTVSLKPSLVPLLIDSDRLEDDLIKEFKQVLKKAKARIGKQRNRKRRDAPSLEHLWEALHFYDKRQEKPTTTLDAIGREAETFGIKQGSSDLNFYSSRGKDVLQFAEHMLTIARADSTEWWNAFS